MKKREQILLMLVVVPAFVLMMLWAFHDDGEPVKPIDPVVFDEQPTRTVHMGGNSRKVQQPVDQAALPKVEERPVVKVDQPPPKNAGPLVLEEVAAPVSIQAAVKAVKPEVIRCVTDQQSRIQGPLEVVLSFKATREGKFTDYALTRSTWQDPYLSACLEDVFAELKFTPSGSETGERVERVFRFGRSASAE